MRSAIACVSPLAATLVGTGCAEAVAVEAGTGGASIVESACGVGPIAIYGRGLCGQPTPMPGCPTPLAAGYTALVGVYQCRFAGSVGACDPGILGSACPTHASLSVDFSAWHPQGMEAGEARVELSVQPSTARSFHLAWSAQEIEPGSWPEKPIGPKFGGEHTLEDVCCKLVFDIYFPIGDYTYRLEVGTDWDTAK